jgi:regulator of sirC expression with transglutaminase-like and TPR domain
MNLERQIYQLFNREVTQPNREINLAKAGLYIAQLNYPHLEIEEYLNALDTMANEISERLPQSSYPLKIIQSIGQYLFEDLGFRGNTEDYYDPRNSYLNDVIERRLGIPITLSVIYLEIAQRLDFPMVGIGMPGHFIIRPEFEGVGIFVDPFYRGEILFEQDCEERMRQIYQQSFKLEPHFLEPITKQKILIRMLTNLKQIYLSYQQFSKAIQMIDCILILSPNHPLELRDRGLIYYQLKQWENSIQDLEKYLAILPNAQDSEAIRQLLETIRTSRGS